MTFSRLAAALLAVAAVACSGAGAGSRSDGPDAVAAVYPLAWLAEQVAPDADVVYLAADGQDPHDLELSPGHRAAVEQAGVAVYLGQIGFQPQVEAAVADRNGPVVDAAQVLGEELLLTIEAHDDEHAEEGEGEEDHADEGAVDPHLWFDPVLMAELATAVGEAFAEADASNAQTYQANAAAARDELLELADELEARLGGCRHDEIIVSHEAYAYLTVPYGLQQHGISSAAGHAEASPADIAALAQEVRGEGIPAVLSEPVEGRADAETVAREAGVELIEIYSLDIVDREQAEQGFPALLREQADAVAQAAQCQGAG